MRTSRLTLLVVWLIAYSTLPVAVVLFALIFAFEGFASLRTHPENVGLALSSALFLFAWPLSALAGWLLLAFRRYRAAAIVSAATACLLALLWLGGLALAAIVGARR